jgi:hypothetical protein
LTFSGRSEWSAWRCLTARVLTGPTPKNGYVTRLMEGPCHVRGENNRALGYGGEPAHATHGPIKQLVGPNYQAVHDFGACSFTMSAKRQRGI